MIESLKSSLVVTRLARSKKRPHAHPSGAAIWDLDLAKVISRSTMKSSLHKSHGILAIFQVAVLTLAAMDAYHRWPLLTRVVKQSASLFKDISLTAQAKLYLTVTEVKKETLQISSLQFQNLSVAFVSAIASHCNNASARSAASAAASAVACRSAGGRRDIGPSIRVTETFATPPQSSTPQPSGKNGTNSNSALLQAPSIKSDCQKEISMLRPSSYTPFTSSTTSEPDHSD